MDLEDLKKEMPFKWRVQSCSKYNAKCVAYIDARDVQDMLDKVCGQDGWQVKYTEHKGNLFCSIGIFGHSEEWIWKEDCGTESNVEKQKGEASDAFKRAGVMWGIGRFLYSKKLVTIKEVQPNGNRFEPTENGKKIWDITEYCNRVGNNPPKKVTQKKQVKPKEKQVLTSDGLIYLTNKGTITEIKKALNERKLTDIQEGALKILLKELESIVDDFPIVNPNNGEVM